MTPLSEKVLAEGERLYDAWNESGDPERLLSFQWWVEERFRYLVAAAREVATLRAEPVSAQQRIAKMDAEGFARFKNGFAMVTGLTKRLRQCERERDEARGVVPALTSDNATCHVCGETEDTAACESCGRAACIDHSVIGEDVDMCKPCIKQLVAEECRAPMPTPEQFCEEVEGFIGGDCDHMGIQVVIRRVLEQRDAEITAMCAELAEVRKLYVDVTKETRLKLQEDSDVLFARNNDVERILKERDEARAEIAALRDEVDSLRAELREAREAGE